MTTAEVEIVEKQVVAYNARDLEAFVGCFHPDVSVYDFPDHLILKGRDALRERYALRFAESEDLRAVIKWRFTAQNYIVDFEEVTGAAFGEASAVAIYEVQDDLIINVWFVRDATI